MRKMVPSVSLRSVLFLLVMLAVDRPFLYISPQVKTMLGFSPEEWREAPMLWERHIHPEDRERVLAETRRGLQQHSKVWFNIEYRMIAKDGRVVWGLDQTVPEYDVSGRLRNLRGLVLDVTGRHTYEEKLLACQEQLRSLASQLSVAEDHERQRIATELHDHVAQKLAIAKIKMEGLKTSPPVNTVDLSPGRHSGEGRNPCFMPLPGPRLSPG